MYFLWYYVVFAMRNNLQLSIAKRPHILYYIAILDKTIYLISPVHVARGAMYIDINMDIVHL